MDKLILFGLLATLPLAAQTYTIGTFAGGGPNDVSATILPVGDIGGVVNDSSGNCYFSSITLNRIFRVDSTGTLFVVAGYGLSGTSGDGGPAAAAGLNGPTSLALDQNGYLYISDTGNNRVRRVLLSTGVITNFAGTGTANFGGDGSAATSATLNTPKGIAADTQGNIYIADSANNRVRIVNGTGIINTFAGTGTPGYNGDNIAANSAELNSPNGLAFDTVNNRLFIADELNYRIRLVTSGSISTVVDQTGVANFSGDGNAAVNATINRPQGLALDASTNLFIADAYNFRIRKVAVSNGVIGNISTVAGSGQPPPPIGNGGPASAARLNYPTAVSLDRANKLYIADRLDDMVRTVPSPYGASTDISLLAGNGAAISPVTFFGDNGLATNAILTNPFGTAISADGNTLLIADQQDDIVRSVNLQTGIITTVAGNGTPGLAGNGGAAISSQLNQPYGVALDLSGNIYIADFGNNRIQRVDVSTGNIGTYAGSATGVSGYSGDAGPAASALLNAPVGLAFDAANNLFVTDYGNNCVRRIAGDTQTITTVIGNCTKQGTPGLTDGDGGPPTAAAALLYNPEGVAVNSTGTVIYVADTRDNKIRWVNNSLLNTFAGTGTPGFLDGVAANQAQLDFPSGVALDNLGNLFIGDAFNNRVRKVQAGNANNTISTVAGGSTQGFGGDGGAATSAELASPFGVTANPINAGIYVSDYGNDRVRLLSLPPAVLTITSSHSGNFTEGQTGATYTITVTNTASTTSTSGTVTVTDTVPTGLTLASMSGTGWNCLGITCTRSDPLDAGASYKAITVTVNVAANAPPIVTNQVAVSGGGSAPASASDPTTILALPSLSVTVGNGTGFIQGAQCAVRSAISGVVSGCPSFGITVTNAAGAGPTSGTITVTDILPAGLAVGFIQPFPYQPWNCSGTPLTCALDTGQPLAGGASAPTLTIYVNVASNAASQVTNVVTVTGGGSASGSATDPVTITANQAVRPSEPGVFRQNFAFFLNKTGSDVFNSPGDLIYYNFVAPQAGDKPVVGDWTGSGTTKIGIFRSGTWFLDLNGDGVFTPGVDAQFSFGQAGDTPVVGDWTGNGKSKIGIVRPFTAGGPPALWVLDYDGNGTMSANDLSKAFAYGGVAGDVPIVGDWTGNGITKVGVVRPFALGGVPAFWLLDANNDHAIDTGDLIFAFGGIQGDIQIAGDWNGSGTSKVGVVRPFSPGTPAAFWLLDGNGSAPTVPGSNDLVYFPFGGIAGDIPLSGKW